MGKEENNNEQNKKPEKDIPLFRKEALEHKRGSYLGKAILITPLSFSFWAITISIIATALILFLYFGTYAKRQEVPGIIVPNKGIINIYAKNPGIVIKKFAEQGEKISKDQLLYLISTEQHTLSDRGAVAQQIELLEKQVEVQKNKLAIYKKNLERYKELLDKKVVSEVEYQKFYDEYLNAEYYLNETKQKLLQAKGSSDYALRSPADGTISTLVAMVGDRVTGDKQLASIVPKGAELEGMLFVPTTSIGFVELGQKVLLKYDAYPYQNFGLYESTVSRIDKSVLSPKDINMAVPAGQTPDPFGQQTFYRVIVTLEQQHVVVYGKKYPLKPGMALRGAMLGDKRNIWQWILEPIYSLKGSLKSS